MAAQLGRNFLLKVGDGGSPAAYTTVGGFRTKTFGSSGSIAETTNQDSGGYRDLLSAAGVLSYTFSGSGTFLDDVAFGTVNTNHRARTANDYQIVVTGLGTYEGQFVVTDLRFAGEHDGEVTFDITLESAGNVAFTAS